MKKYDINAQILTYAEYVQEAQKLKDEGWYGFQIYPERPGVVYVLAYNPVLKKHRILTLKEYVKLRDSGLWARGFDRLKGATVDYKPQSNSKVSSGVRFNRLFSDMTSFCGEIYDEATRLKLEKILDKYRK